MLSNPVFEFGPQEFVRGSPETRFPSSPDYDFDEPTVLLCWFRRDEYIDQTVLAAHGKAGTDGWRFMLKGCEPEHQFVNIQCDVNNPQRNIYKILKPINNKYDHFCAWIWNPTRKFYDGYEAFGYTDADGRTTAKDGVPACLVFDGSVDHIWRAKDAASSIWTVASADRDLGIGRDSVTGLPKFGMTGAVYDFKIFKGDYGAEDAIEYYNDTKENYNLEPDDDEMVTCFGKNTGVFHMAPGGGFFDDGGMCLNPPIDASEYPTADRLYVYANIGGYSRANIRTIFPDGSDDVFYESGDYMWIYWDWNDWSGDVEFELRDGTSVKARRSTHIKGAAPPHVCDEGEERSPEACWDGSEIHKEVCRNNAWVPSGETCPDEPEPDLCDGVVCDDVCAGDDMHTSYCYPETGECIAGIIIPNHEDCVTPDPCKGVACPYVCDGYDKWSQKCVVNDADEAECVPDARVETNSAFCGYKAPEKDKTTWLLISVAVVLFYLMARGN